MPDSRATWRVAQTHLTICSAPTTRHECRVRGNRQVRRASSQAQAVVATAADRRLTHRLAHHRPNQLERGEQLCQRHHVGHAPDVLLDDDHRGVGRRYRRPRPKELRTSGSGPPTWTSLRPLWVGLCRAAEAGQGRLCFPYRAHAGRRAVVQAGRPRRRRMSPQSTFRCQGRSSRRSRDRQPARFDRGDPCRNRRPAEGPIANAQYRYRLQIRNC